MAASYLVELFIQLLADELIFLLLLIQIQTLRPLVRFLRRCSFVSLSRKPVSSLKRAEFISYARYHLQIYYVLSVLQTITKLANRAILALCLFYHFNESIGMVSRTDSCPFLNIPGYV